MTTADELSALSITDGPEKFAGFTLTSARRDHQIEDPVLQDQITEAPHTSTDTPKATELAIPETPQQLHNKNRGYISKKVMWAVVGFCSVLSLISIKAESNQHTIESVHVPHDRTEHASAAGLLPPQNGTTTTLPRTQLLPPPAVLPPITPSSTQEIAQQLPPPNVEPIAEDPEPLIPAVTESLFPQPNPNTFIPAETAEDGTPLIPANLVKGYSLNPKTNDLDERIDKNNHVWGWSVVDQFNRETGSHFDQREIINKSIELYNNAFPDRDRLELRKMGQWEMVVNVDNNGHVKSVISPELNQFLNGVIEGVLNKGGADKV